MLKSIVSFPTDSSLFISKPRNQQSERLVTYYELYKLIKHLNGSILKCGITHDEAFSYFSFFKQINQYGHQPMVAFEKNPSLFEVTKHNNKEEGIAVKNIHTKQVGAAQQNLIEKGITEKIEFVPGLLNNSIPEYLIQNPELKIALLTIDIDDFESTLTAMQYFYPRIVSGGILIMNNYYKKSAENMAIQEYFVGHDIIIRHFSLEKGPHYIVKP
ncbi:MAG: TylF/MycF family methyltransferase [Chitinophagaceae bacterium]|jgi:hypothetical protein|nr:TylF/MycF family methyltransferase [Chitinophagaceae bacterium]